MNDKVLQVVGEVFSILFVGLLFLVAYVGVIQRLRRGPAAAARAIGDDGWGPWFRQNFDKLLLFLAWLIAMLLALHMMKTSTDASNIAWWREVAGTVLGAFLGLVQDREWPQASAETPSADNTTWQQNRGKHKREDGDHACSSGNWRDEKNK